MTASEILRLIETCSPDDVARMDEIDARVTCYLSHSTFVGFRFRLDWNKWGVNTKERGWILCRPYTQSRDALKAIRPSNLQFQIERFNYDGFAKYYAVVGGEFDHDGILKGYESPALPTEELAELHAIIQAIEHDRGNND